MENGSLPIDVDYKVRITFSEAVEETEGGFVFGVEQFGTICDSFFKQGGVHANCFSSQVLTTANDSVLME